MYIYLQGREERLGQVLCSKWFPYFPSILIKILQDEQNYPKLEKNKIKVQKNSISALGLLVNKY